MYVKNKMIKDIVTVFPEASVSLAFQIMHERNVSQLPVVKEGKLVGLVTEALLSEFTPSKATTLSMYELNYILGKTTVETIMSKDVITCDENMLIENVAIIMNETDVNMIPIVDAAKNLLGIISRSDIIESFIEIIGARDKGTRLTVISPDEAGRLAGIAQIIKKSGVSITHLSNFNNPATNLVEVIIRLDTLDVTNIVSDLVANGFDILRIDKNE
jgi:acetoin utilization protein AcuB